MKHRPIKVDADALKLSDADIYNETSLPRCAYLVALGHKPESIKWRGNPSEGYSASFQFRRSNKLGMDVLKWKGSSANALLEAYIFLAGEIAKYKRGAKLLQPYATDIAEELRNWSPRF